MIAALDVENLTAQLLLQVMPQHSTNLFGVSLEIASPFHDLLSSKSQSKEQTWPHLLHLVRAQSGYKRADFPFRNGLKMIEVDGAILGHAVCLGQHNFGWNIPDP
jgi:hypothetical protein